MGPCGLGMREPPFLLEVVPAGKPPGQRVRGEPHGGGEEGGRGPRSFSVCALAACRRPLGWLGCVCACGAPPASGAVLSGRREATELPLSPFPMLQTGLFSVHSGPETQRQSQNSQRQVRRVLRQCEQRGVSGPPGAVPYDGELGGTVPSFSGRARGCGQKPRHSHAGRGRVGAGTPHLRGKLRPAWCPASPPLDPSAGGGHTWAPAASSLGAVRCWASSFTAVGPRGAGSPAKKTFYKKLRSNFTVPKIHTLQGLRAALWAFSVKLRNSHRQFQNIPVITPKEATPVPICSDSPRAPALPPLPPTNLPSACPGCRACTESLHAWPAASGLLPGAPGGHTERPRSVHPFIR